MNLRALTVIFWVGLIATAAVGGDRHRAQAGAAPEHAGPEEAAPREAAGETMLCRSDAIRIFETGPT